MRGALAGLLLACAALLPAQAAAWPVTELLDLKVGSERIVRSWAKAIDVDDPSVVTAELLASREILLTPKKPGRALLFLLNDGQFDAVRIRVRDTGGAVPEQLASEAQIAAARRACNRLVVEKTGTLRSVSAEAIGPACRAALKELLKGDEFRVKELSLMFTDDGIQDQIGEIHRRLAGGVGEGITASYVGVTLRLTGTASQARKLEVLKAAFESSVGRVLLDDRVETPAEPKPEAAAAPAAESEQEVIEVEIVPMPPEELEKARRTRRKPEGRR